MKLARQEERIVLLRISGLNDRGVAEELGLTVDTVRSYWKRIRFKMDGQSRAQIIVAFTRASAAQEIDAIRAETELLKKEIEKRRKVERLLRESEGKYRMLFENTLDAIFLTDEQRCFVDVNPTMARLLGYERNDLIGRNFEDFVHSSDIEKSRKIRKLALKKGFWDDNLYLMHRNGKPICMRFRSMLNVVPNQVLAVGAPIKPSRKTSTSRPIPAPFDFPAPPMPQT